MNRQTIDAAIYNLQIMDHNGELQLPQPWTNDKGDTQIPWDVETHGPVLACYMNMLGLDLPSDEYMSTASLANFRIPRGPRKR
jgi:hypothetical protein